MEKYKRLTKRDEEFGIIALCPACSRKATCEKQEECVDCLDEMQERLAELEDDIESGKLIRLPCKVGDNVWVIDYYNKIEEVTVLDYTINKKGFILEVVNEDILSKYYLYDFDFNKDWFLTKAEAEKKIGVAK